MRLTSPLPVRLVSWLCLRKRMPVQMLTQLTQLLCLCSVDMIPLMMQKGYKANGWLGLVSQADACCAK